MKNKTLSNSQVINGIAFGFSAMFLISAWIAARYTGEWGSVFKNWFLIMITPSPLVTDYFAIGGLASAMLNAGACGMACFLAMVLLKGESHANTLAGYFLVVAHCFYGLNFLNMWPCFLAPFLYLKWKKLNFNDNLHVCMFATSFGPFISEFLFRYTQGDAFEFGTVNLTLSGVTIAIVFALALGFVVPAILPGAKAWHKGYNLYNGGLAFGVFGFFVYDLLYKTFGVTPPQVIEQTNEIYDRFDHNYQFYGTMFFLTIFVLCIAVGYYLNGNSFSGYRKFLKDTGYSSNFAAQYGMPLCLINLGFYGIFFLIYINLIISLTPGAGFTGATVGVILASLTFTAVGQHPKNVWPILAGYMLLYLVTQVICYMDGREIAWSISTQGYINGVAFATGLCPIIGRYGVRAGIAAGFLCASMCTATRDLHGGLVLYNGGFTAGITALILLPILEHYIPAAREELKEQKIDFQSMITLVYPNTSEKKKADRKQPTF
ncbi:MAG: DUF1576 domain-containing protein [Lachnospiraceae bacterium]|nr:DUF1576 domain-containing protein [Lachnospiraceae bacterium]MBQ6856439.1 DUF1576 domain-containing protein [Lachnospiraceae bacterium]